ncbi:CRISPR system Cascade subunit CasC [Barrientosiimonas humi]|uniref:CRISPR system Cascade subunit CasC n=1 Tax=Barrientosiimonas humi TaxID=999931 RepID=A0A542XFU6_9MICO|nr:type I-E CRISPR-associated protein Cas7/Cse4/CasC [Barrientosiimonas humi]TQL34697.1 CRISPR system Cascade subunit CasC [Barrientosiimonas humi]CAG7574687.1 CRISPR system Cascade subunit CasC [Barrientosiimonas humi]
MATFIDIHVLQTVPPSNLNRDDTGSPKSALYGGVRRARVSSQAWKRAARKAYEQSLERADVGYRTKRIVELMVARMQELQPDVDGDEARQRAEGVLKALGIKVTQPRAKKDASPDDAEPYPVSDYLIFFSTAQIDRLAELALDGDAGKTVSKKDAVAAADSEHGIEVGLFGRMVADNKELSVDAAVQVAHAISTHAVDIEQDYFTAVDDKNPEDESGAGMLGTIEFNSATIYRYATINLDGLFANLGDEQATVRAAQAFVHAFVSSMPTGKQNTFANRTVPDAAVIMVRTGQPVNLVGAFEDPVQPDRGLVAGSAAKLAEATRGVSSFVAEPELTLVVRGNDRAAALDELGDVATLAEAVERLAEPIRAAVSAPAPA